MTKKKDMKRDIINHQKLKHFREKPRRVQQFFLMDGYGASNKSKSKKKSEVFKRRQGGRDVMSNIDIIKLFYRKKKVP